MTLFKFIFIFSCLFLISGHSLIAGINDGLVAYYALDENSGTTQQDSSWNGNSASFVGNPTWVSGKFGSALEFDGVNDYLKADTDFIGSTPITFCSWIYPAGPVGNKNLVSNGSFIVGFGSNNRISVSNNGLSYLSSLSWAINENVWQHVCVSRDLDGASTMYVNGEQNGSGNQTAGGIPLPGKHPVRIAALKFTGLFNGLMDDVRLYSRVLSSDEISLLYNTASPVAPAPSANRPPNVSAGESQKVFLSSEATLYGSVSDDGLPSSSSLAIEWEIYSTPEGGTVSFGNSQSATTTATFSKTGRYYLKLTASDSEYSVSALLPILVEASLSPVPYTSCGTDCYQVTALSIPDINAALDAALAANGGTVKLPAGSATFTSSLSKEITKDLVLTGAGDKETHILDDIPTGLFWFTVNDDVMFHLTNMKFIQVSNQKSSNAVLSLSGTSYRHILSKLHFDHTGDEMGPAIMMVNQNDLVEGGGLFYDIIIDMRSKSSTMTGISIIGSIPSGWAVSPDWGSPYKWYIEDSTMNFVYQHANDVVDSYRGARFVFRHNRVDGTTPGMHGYDSDTTGAQSMEVYKNIFTSNHPVSILTTRSGTVAIWDNTFTSPPLGSAINVSLYRSALDTLVSGRCDGTNPMDGNRDPSGYPCYHQPGVAGVDGLTSFPMLEWNNKTTAGADIQFGYNGNFIPPQVKSGPSQYDHVKEGRDYLNDTTCSGPLDYSKPWVADPETVNQTCGKFWDTVNNKAKNYIPYTYPHPFRSNPRAPLNYVTGPPTYADQTIPYLTVVPSFDSKRTDTSVAITWGTNKQTVSQIEYGLTKSYGGLTPLNSTFATSHTQQITGLSPGTLYHYRFVYFDRDGRSAVSRDGIFTTLGEGTGGSGPLDAADGFEKFPNVFNPAQETLTIVYRGGRDVHLTIYDHRGSEIKTLEASDSGHVVWDGRNDKNKIVSSGVYIILLEGKTNNDRKKVVVVK